MKNLAKAFFAAGTVAALLISVKIIFEFIDSKKKRYVDLEVRD